MSMLPERNNARRADQLRPLALTYDIFPYAPGSVLFSLGYTKVMCSVMMQQGVPHFLKGKKRGWLAVDYNLLPASTPVRTLRDSALGKKNERSIEISRLLGRTLRSILLPGSMGENTIFVDCDVICADGGTRAAALCGAFLALRMADQHWRQTGQLKCSLLADEIAALSVGIVENKVLIDLDCAEDNHAQADFTIVLTRTGKLVEVQGGAEKEAVSRDNFNTIIDAAFSASNEFFAFYDAHSLRPHTTYAGPACPPIANF